MTPLIYAGLLGLACIPVGIGIVVLYRLCADWADRRSYVPPTIHTEVDHWARETDKTAHEEESAQVAPWALQHGHPYASAWALDALSEVRKAAAEDDYATLCEFAGRVASSPALIWADMVGRRTVLGLVTA